MVSSVAHSMAVLCIYCLSDLNGILKRFFSFMLGKKCLQGINSVTGKSKEGRFSTISEFNRFIIAQVSLKYK